MNTIISCQGCGKEIHYGFTHFIDCNPIANGDCDCLGRMIDDANTQHHCMHGEDMMRDMLGDMTEAALEGGNEHE